MKKMHGRFFAGRQVEAHIMDRKEKYHQSSNRVTEEEEQARLKSFGSWIGDDGEEEEED